MAKEGSEEDMEKGAWEWVPNERIGPLVFAKPMSDFIERLKLRLETDDAIPGIEPTVYYDVPGMDKIVYEDDGLLESVISDDIIIYKGINLIGMTESQILKLLGQDPTDTDEFDFADEEGGAPNRVFTFDELGLQVWCLEDRVYSVTCWRDEGEEEDRDAEA